MPNLCVGTVGSGIFVSEDVGETWAQARLEVPYPPWSPWIQFRSVVASPHDPLEFMGGSDIGLHRSQDGGLSWTFLPSPADQMQVWSVTYHPTDTGTIYVGLAPFDSDLAIIRSRDAGLTWERLALEVSSRSQFGATHVTNIVVDPSDADVIWAGTEVGGLYHSKDGGDTWETLGPCGDTATTGDIHSVIVTSEGRVYASTPDGVWRLRDEGGFDLHRFPSFPEPEPIAEAFGVTAYTRGMAWKRDDPRVVFAGVGDFTPGKVGDIFRSPDGGETWSACGLREASNSHVYAIATTPADPELLVAATMFGQVWISRDGGQDWSKIRREFGEIRGLALQFGQQ